MTYLPADGVEEEEEPGQPQINQAGQPLPGLSVFSNGTTGDSVSFMLIEINIEPGLICLVVVLSHYDFHGNVALRNYPP